jgi:hypothetical protein
VSRFHFLTCAFLSCGPVIVTLIAIDRAHAFTSDYAFPVVVVVYLSGLWAGSVMKVWFHLGRIAYGLADEAATGLSQNAALEVQNTHVMRRRLPPRQMYASAIAREGEPIVMYRGWRLFSVKPLSRPENSRTPGLTCWRHW